MSRRLLPIVLVIPLLAAACGAGTAAAGATGAVCPNGLDTGARVVDGVPVGYRQTECGEVSAAFGFAAVFGVSSASDIESITLKLSAICEPAALQPLLVEAQKNHQWFIDASPGTKRTVIAVAYQLISFKGKKHARVSFWILEQTRAPDQAVSESWALREYDLKWLNDDWKMESPAKKTSDEPPSAYPNGAPPRSSRRGLGYVLLPLPQPSFTMTGP